MFKKKVYVKDESNDPIYKAKNKSFIIKSRIIPMALMVIGVSLLGSQVIYPLVSFRMNKETTKVESSVLGTMSGFKDFEFRELASEKQEIKEKEVPEYFSLSIPKLGIEKALVEVNAESLDPKDALGHYRGSEIPGETGNSFIYGHSVLPWFFNPKNYKTIFSTLEKLEAGDKILIEINEEKLTYVVENKETLNPESVDPLKEFKPKFLNESTITLMTCVPPGTKLKRLLVYAVRQ